MKCRSFVAPLCVSLLAAALGGCDAPSSGGPAASGSAGEVVMTLPLQVGEAAPSVTVSLHDGQSVELGKPSDKKTVVYFYPKDDTPGCTVEAEGFRDLHAEFEQAGVRVLGVSSQGKSSHQGFVDKYSLPFGLVMDETGDVARAFRVPLRLGFASRQTFLIGKDGKIEAVWLDVSPKEHPQAVLAKAKGG